MTNKEAIEILTLELKHNKAHLHFEGKAPEYYEELGNICKACESAIKALDLLERLEGFKYVTTEVLLKEHEVAHFDIYKRGWNDAIQAVIDASDMPVTDIIKAIKENEVKQNDI